MRLLALGGPKALHWLDDTDSNIFIVIEAKYVVAKYVVAAPENILTADPRYTEHMYVKERLAIGDITRWVYVLSGYSREQALEDLKNYLLEKFIKVEMELTVYE